MALTQSLVIILQFAFATLLPALVGVVLTGLEHHRWLSGMGYWQRQLLYGVAFGAVAVFGTEFGIQVDDATMNVRDAAPIVAGLYFGSPAGIIAGLIGGVERWFAALWGRGMFTRVACSVATIVAGLYAALLNRSLFDDRRPSWPLACAVGVVAEVLHLLLVFLTNLDDVPRALAVVLACTLPMVCCNGIGVATAGAAIARANGQPIRRQRTLRDISQVIQAGMLAVVGVGFLATVCFTFALQQNTLQISAHYTLDVAISDVEADIHDASDENLLALTRGAAEVIPSVDDASDELIAQLIETLDVSEIHVVDSRGIIVASSGQRYVGFDMHSGEQSRAFLDLLPGGSSTYYVQDYQPMTIDQRLWRKFAGVRIEGGFIQVGYDSRHFLDDIASLVRFAVANRHVGLNGLVVVCEADGTLVGSRHGVSVSQEAASRLLADAAPHADGTLFTTTLDDTSYYAIARDVEGLRLVALLPEEEAIGTRNLAVIVTSFMEVLVFAALFAAIYVLIRRVVVRSIWQVNGALDRITSGDLKARVDVRGSKEFASLSDDINRTVDALRDAIAAESARIERDLATARAIQESALPRTFPPFPDVDAFDIYASTNPAREVGGDFYDFFMIDDHTLGFLIADVSGKGIPASLFMMAAKSELANYMSSGMDLAEAVGSANRSLCQRNDPGMFVTVWAATLDYLSGTLTYVNAGHNPPLLRHGGTWEWLSKKGGLFLGTFETARYRSTQLTLEAGDELLLYTDGVNEAFSVDEEEYGNERLEAFLAAHDSLHPHALVDSLREELRMWAKDAEQSDDITMLCLEFGVPPEVSETVTVDATDEGLHELVRRIHFSLSQVRCPGTVQRQVVRAVEELFAAAREHGPADAQEAARIQFSLIYNANPDAIVASVTDWGAPFDPLSDQEARPEVDGAGAGLAAALNDMDDAAYVRDGDCNVTAFRKAW